MVYYAHSGQKPDKTDWQTLKGHLEAVAVLARDRASYFGLDRAAFIAGLFHDLGKYNPAFQRRLDGAKETVDHSTAGAQVLCDLARGEDGALAQIIAYSILGHHAGLPDRLDGPGTFDHRMKHLQTVDPVWMDELAVDISGLVPDMVRNFPRNREGCAFAWAFMGRMLFSALVDSDFVETESYYKSLGQRVADRDWPALSELIDDLVVRFDAHMASFAGREGDLNQLRRDVLAHVRAGAELQPGLFTLTVPTGGGKTLASLGFALDHARLHGHRRIIYAIPFTSIIEQTVDIFRSVLGAENVLEHHSAIDEDGFENKQRERKDKLKLAMEDWAAPVIVTTTVQLFESLFTARPSRARKLHNIAGSIIILDEAQTLPKSLLIPIMRALEELARSYGCTFVLCTATQPALGKRPDFPQGLPLEGRELAPDPVGLSKMLARTRIVHAGDMSSAALIEALRGRDQALVIVNSRRHALELYKEAVAEDLGGLVHLTTRQYASHRRRILNDVRDRLKSGKPCRLIATSLIEAGVDVDFPVAWRAEAGLDQIIRGGVDRNRFCLVLHLLPVAVASLAEAWIETSRRATIAADASSPPSRRRGSKPGGPRWPNRSRWSPPSRRRGSKQDGGAYGPTVRVVASLAEAWIETARSSFVGSGCSSPPSRRCGSKPPHHTSAPPARSRLPRGGVDRNMRPWCIVVTTIMSPPSRRRGSKRHSIQDRLGDVVSPPSRRRGSKWPAAGFMDIELRCSS